MAATPSKSGVPAITMPVVNWRVPSPSTVITRTCTGEGGALGATAGKVRLAVATFRAKRRPGLVAFCGSTS